ncbi:hypothetical protein [Streptomyces sasae]|uniref:hypothetical protein n=1 Tax=Streptomyces sasae TaxID=1266772 RepID=UPI00292DF48A|nr:hypothetical protein [Streptomyces sasae]
MNSGGFWWPWISPSVSRPSPGKSATKAASSGVEDILVALRTCGIDVPGATHERITDRDGPDRLRLWLPRAATATSAEELFDGS